MASDWETKGVGLSFLTQKRAHPQFWLMFRDFLHKAWRIAQSIASLLGVGRFYFEKSTIFTI